MDQEHHQFQIQILQLNLLPGLKTQCRFSTQQGEFQIEHKNQFKESQYKLVNIFSFFFAPPSSLALIGFGLGFYVYASYSRLFQYCFLANHIILDNMALLRVAFRPSVN